MNLPLSLKSSPAKPSFSHVAMTVPPPGRHTRTSSAAARRWSGANIAPNVEITRSNEASANGRSWASASTHSTSTPASAARRRACSNSSGVISRRRPSPRAAPPGWRRSRRCPCPRRGSPCPARARCCRGGGYPPAPRGARSRPNLPPPTSRARAHGMLLDLPFADATTVARISPCDAVSHAASGATCARFRWCPPIGGGHVTNT